MKIWDLSNGFNDTFLYIKFDITLLYIIEKGTCFCKCLFLQRTVKIDIFVFGAEGAAAYKTGPVCSMPASCTGVISISGRSFR